MVRATLPEENVAAGVKQLAATLANLPGQLEGVLSSAETVIADLDKLFEENVDIELGVAQELVTRYKASVSAMSKVIESRMAVSDQNPASM